MGSERRGAANDAVGGNAATIVRASIMSRTVAARAVRERAAKAALPRQSLCVLGTGTSVGFNDSNLESSDSNTWPLMSAEDSIRLKISQISVRKWPSDTSLIDKKQV